MSVLLTQREIAETEYLNRAKEIRVEVTRLVMNEKAIPKRYRFVYATSAIDACRELIDNGYKYDNCKYDKEKSEITYERQKMALLGMLDAIDKIFSELQMAKLHLHIKISPYERVVALLVDENELIKHKLDKLIKSHKDS